jgi:hypothetical protein
MFGWFDERLNGPVSLQCITMVMLSGTCLIQVSTHRSALSFW